jgi:hypothetical protein
VLTGQSVEALDVADKIRAAARAWRETASEEVPIGTPSLARRPMESSAWRTEPVAVAEGVAFERHGRKSYRTKRAGDDPPDVRPLRRIPPPAAIALIRAAASA